MRRPMQDYVVELRGEDGMEFVFELPARDQADALHSAEVVYPEAKVLNVERKGAREQRFYERALRREEIADRFGDEAADYY